jgi:hypothetical protein
MSQMVAVTTILAALLGAYIGYGMAGIGGAIFYGALIGVGGTLLGRLVFRTAVLVGPWWRVVLAITAVIVVMALTWGVYL